jgi:MFS family permease
MSATPAPITTSSAHVTELRSGASVVDSASNAARTLAVAAFGTLLVLSTFSAVVTTVGDSARSLQGGVAGQTWALSGMSLGLAAALLMAGALADDFGRRRVLVWSAALLAATSALGALAPSMGVLVAARVLQGVAGAGVLAASLGSIGHAFPAGPRRTRATGVWAAAVGGGIALGPLAGAALATALGWRSSYGLEAVAAAALVPAAAIVAESRAATARRLDLAGVVTLAAGMASLTAGLVEGRSSWSSTTTVGLLAGGALLLAGFAVIEVLHRHPMLELRLFAEPQFVASVTGALFTGLAVIGLMSYSPTVIQRALHASILGSAAVLATWSATSMIVALAARRLPGGLQSQSRLAIGFALCAAGELALSGLGTGSSWTRLVPGLIVAGVGSGIANAALGRLAVESVPRDRAGMGSGANNTARYLGGAAGIALVVAVGSSDRAGELIRGWNSAALISASLCVIGALIALRCRTRPS